MLDKTPIATFAMLTGRLIILRGVPGSGKSTLAIRLADEKGYVHLEADTHFWVNGKYKFDPARVADAHAVVVRDALDALLYKRAVVIANTHIKCWEMAGAIGAARLAGLNDSEIQFVECLGTWENTHAVPSEIVARMRTRFEVLPATYQAQSFCWKAEDAS